VADEHGDADLVELLDRRAIRLAEQADDRDSAIRLCGATLVDIGAVDPTYVDAMLAREQSISTYVGEGVAIPHGTLVSKESVKRDALAVLRFPEGVDWGGFPVILMDPDQAQALRDATDPDEVLRLLEPLSSDE
jgi:PTS system mannitol-specific IIA component